MPPKAKGKKTQKAVKDVPLTTDQLIKKSIETLTSRHASVVDRLISNQSINQYVYLTLHLYECPYIKHDWVVNQSTTLSTIIDRLESVHGSTKSIKLYRMMSSISQSINQSIHHEFELIDRTLSLADLGCVAGPRYPVNQSINQDDESNDVPVVRYDIIYDFLPTNQSPILMREPSVSHIDGLIDGLTDRLADQSMIQPTNEAIQLLPYVGTHLQDSSFHGQRFHTDHPTRQSINRPIGHISSMYAERFHGDHLINPIINQSNSDDDDSYDDTPVAGDKSKAFAALLA